MEVLDSEHFKRNVAMESNCEVGFSVVRFLVFILSLFCCCYKRDVCLVSCMYVCSFIDLVYEQFIRISVRTD